MSAAERRAVLQEALDLSHIHRQRAALVHGIPQLQIRNVIHDQPPAPTPVFVEHNIRVDQHTSTDTSSTGTGQQAPAIVAPTPAPVPPKPVEKPVVVVKPDPTVPAPVATPPVKVVEPTPPAPAPAHGTNGNGLLTKSLAVSTGLLLSGLMGAAAYNLVAPRPEPQVVAPVESPRDGNLLEYLRDEGYNLPPAPNGGEHGSAAGPAD